MTDTIDLALVRQGDALLAEAYRLAGDNAKTLATRQAQWIASDMVEKDVSMATAPNVDGHDKRLRLLCLSA